MLIEQITTRPTAEINGIIGGYTGEGAKTVIPGEATAKVSFRLVGQQNPKKIRDAFRKFVRERLPADAKVEFNNFGLAPPIQLPFDNPALLKTRAALAAEWGRKAVTVGEGGSIPIVADFKRVLGMDTLMVGFALDDDRVHSPNEKYDLQSFHKGTRSWARILAALAGEPKRAWGCPRCRFSTVSSFRCIGATMRHRMFTPFTKVLRPSLQSSLVRSSAGGCHRGPCGSSAIGSSSDEPPSW